MSEANIHLSERVEYERRIAELEAERNRLRKALDFYAYGGGRDSGLRARQALGEETG